MRLPGPVVMMAKKRQQSSSTMSESEPSREASQEKELKPQDSSVDVVRIQSTPRRGHHQFESVGSKLTPSQSYRADEIEQEYPGFLVVLANDDPRHPLNWSTPKKLIHTCAFGFTTFAAQFGASVISPAGEQIAAEFNVGTEIGTLAFSVYLLGNMIGPMIFAPLSEVAGRKVGVLVPCLIAGLLMCMTANVSSVAALVVIRFLTGVFAAAPIVSSGGAMADMWRATHRAAAMVLYSINVIGGSSCSPTIGALLTTTGSYGWRWTLWTGGLLQMVIPVLNMLFLSECYPPALEKKLAHKLRISTGVWALHSRLDMWKLTFEEFVRLHCLRPILMLATPIQFLLTLYSSFVFGILFLAITTVGDSFVRVHNFAFAASFCPLFALLTGFLFGGALNIWNSRRFARVAQDNDGYAAPEERLIAMMFFGWFSPCGLFIYGWTMKPWIHWIVPCIGLAFMGGGLAVIFQGCLVYMVDAYTKYAASAIAANTIVRSVFGGVFPLFALQMFHKLGIHWAASLLGFVALGLWPMSWLFYFFGAKIRLHDPYEKFLR